VVLLDDRGKGPESLPGGLAPRLAQAGALALAVDLRGWGETVWVNETFNWSAERRDPLSADVMLGNVGLMLGHWSVTQRVQDVLGVLRYLRTRLDVDPSRIILAGRGGGAVVALHAAAVDGTVAGVVCYDALASYRAIVDAPRHVHPAADLLPDVLLHYDLPALAAALAPAPVLIVGPQDAMGQPLGDRDAAASFGPAKGLASQLGGNLSVYVSPAGNAGANAAPGSLAGTRDSSGEGLGARHGALQASIVEWIAAR
jgi:hypothetical protein